MNCVNIVLSLWIGCLCCSTLFAPLSQERDNKRAYKSAHKPPSLKHNYFKKINLKPIPSPHFTPEQLSQQLPIARPATEQLESKEQPPEPNIREKNAAESNSNAGLERLLSPARQRLLAIHGPERIERGLQALNSTNHPVYRELVEMVELEQDTGEPAAGDRGDVEIDFTAALLSIIADQLLADIQKELKPF